MINDVESILNEIKERVRADEESPSRANVVVSHHAPVEIKTELDGNESLARAAAHLTTTARAWDRLPPIVSNRRGAAARIELWVKVQFKSLARWFTWEQINFNAAVHHALSESVATLTSHQHELLALRRELEEINGELHKLRGYIEEQGRSSEAKSQAINASLEEMNAAVARLSVMLSDLAAETRASHSQLANTRLPELAADIDARLAEIRSDLREEQRVCFKQLSLETSEAAVLEDRGRRALEARLEKLERGKPS